MELGLKKITSSNCDLGVQCSLEPVNKIFCPDILAWFLVILFQKIMFLHWIYNANINQHILDQQIHCEQQVHPGTKINGLKCTDVQMNVFEKYFVQFLHVSSQCLL